MKPLICCFLALSLALSTAQGAEKLELPPLTSIPGSPRLVGKFVWADLVTDDVVASRKFYSRLFGWTYRGVGNYLLAESDERPLAGMFQRERPADQSARPRWIPYMSVSGVKEAEAHVKAAGGKVLAPPKNYPQRGDQAVFADPEGAAFGVIASRRGVQGDFSPSPGEWIWIQLFSRDAKAAGEFYQVLGNYEVMPNTERTNSLMLVADGYARAAVMTIPADKPQIKPAWLPFVRVSSMAEAVRQTREFGGSVLIAPKENLFEGRVAVIADPRGAAIGIMEWSHEEPGRGE